MHRKRIFLLIEAINGNWLHTSNEFTFRTNATQVQCVLCYAPAVKIHLAQHLIAFFVWFYFAFIGLLNGWNIRQQTSGTQIYMRFQWKLMRIKWALMEPNMNMLHFKYTNHYRLYTMHTLTCHLFSLLSIDTENCLCIYVSALKLDFLMACEDIHHFSTIKSRLVMFIVSYYVFVCSHTVHYLRSLSMMLL